MTPLNIVKEGSAVVNSTTNKRSIDDISNIIMKQITMNVANVTKIIKPTAATCVRNVLSEIKVTIKSYSTIAC